MQTSESIADRALGDLRRNRGNPRAAVVRRDRKQDGAQVGSRETGWSAVAHATRAREAYAKWIDYTRTITNANAHTITHTLTIHDLVLARDHASLIRDSAHTDEINAALRHELTRMMRRD